METRIEDIEIATGAGPMGGLVTGGTGAPATGAVPVTAPPPAPSVVTPDSRIWPIVMRAGRRMRLWADAVLSLGNAIIMISTSTSTTRR